MYKSTNTMMSGVVLGVDTKSIEKVIEQTNTNIRYLKKLGIGLDAEELPNNFVNNQMVLAGYKEPKQKRAKKEPKCSTKANAQRVLFDTKEVQKKQMKILDKTIEDKSPVKYMKANVIANKAVSIKFGLDKSIKKENMNEEMLEFRDIVLEKITALMIAKDMGIVEHVSTLIYDDIKKGA